MSESPAAPVFLAARRTPGTGGPGIPGRAVAAGRPRPVARADLLICGVPWDTGSSFRRGPAAGPAAIREASWVLEEYSLAARRSLEELVVLDAGDCPVRAGDPDPEATAQSIAEWARGLVSAHLAPDGLMAALGGDHLATVPLVRAWRDLAVGGPPPCVLILDAHADLRHQYEGQTWSHACVTARLIEMLGPARVQAVGVRSATAEETDVARELGLAWSWRGVPEPVDIVRETDEALARLPADGPLYLSVDIDVCDPGAAPGVGAPEPGGVSALELIRAVRNVAYGAMGRLRAMDVVEVSPEHDAGGATATLAAKLVREAALARLSPWGIGRRG